MALEKEDIIELQSILDDRYVKQKDCDERQERVNNKFANDDKRIEVMGHDFQIIKWLVTTVAASGLATLVVEVMALLMK